MGSRGKTSGVIGFTDGAGSLAVGQSIEVQARFSKADWTNYIQTKDYSYNESNNNYTDWLKTTGYIGNELAWGIEP